MALQLDSPIDAEPALSKARNGVLYVIDGTIQD
jgi:hypothetical protein